MPNVVLKPGLTLGPYPERKEDQADELEQRLRTALHKLRSKHNQKTLAPQILARKVNKAAQGFDALSDDQLNKVINKLRTDLRYKGLKPGLIVGAFAVIREAAERALGKRFHDVQLLGGWTMINGTIAEMETGQGKTFTTTLPACTAALAGIPVHIMTANDYLAQRDQETLAPLYQRLGLTSSVLSDGQAHAVRQQIYQSAIVHGSGPQFTFDYLRDRLAMGAEASPNQLYLHQQIARKKGLAPPLLMRGLCFAIVDEIDSVLIDEARTPLIISRQRQSSDEQNQCIDALFLARALNQESDFKLTPETRSAQLTTAGKLHLTELCRTLGEAWQRHRHREFYTEQALRALYLFHREKDYIVRDKRVMIVDPLTGRTMPDRSWDQGLHQLIEAKEGVEITGVRDAQAKITYQEFFRRYLFLTGLSGTVTESATELRSVYGLEYQRIPTHQSSRRQYQKERIYSTEECLKQALLTEIKSLHGCGQPLLIGTRSIEESQQCSQWLHNSGLPHRVFNAHQDAEEANIIAAAGNAGAITIATNMAGRGTDIALGQGVAQMGGLHVIAIGRNSSRRVDRQLFGRCARQGDPGSVSAYGSLQDPAISQFYPTAILKLVRCFAKKSRPLPAALGALIARLPQRRQERQERKQRLSLIKQNQFLSRALAFSGHGE
ncbi:hypothetical protein [Halioxenophilus aromaticivorans]|uniref:Protein translocase subunit SecA n=1 Tax=Halioxenophilus aromaticivorans TaxID=1306992 RepID=A0AAV3U1Y6_9ALTE